MQEGENIVDELARLEKAVVSIVAEEFERTGRVVLLSNLGQDLLKGGVDYRPILDKRRLADFIRTELADRVTLVPVPGKDKVVGIHPAGVDLANQENPFGPAPAPKQPVGKIEADEEKRPMLHRQVWFAFSHFLADGQVRLLELQPEPVYRDVPENSKLPEGGHKVDRELIVPVGSMVKSDRDAQIYENITRWARDTNIPLSGLVATKEERAERRNLLDELLRTLGHSELARISIPLDIVKTLRERRI